MKKKLFLILSIIVLSGANLLAQNDGFFTSSYTEFRETDNDWGFEMPALPGQHGVNYDFAAEAPLGSGVLLLAAFAMLRLKRNDK